MRDRRAQRPEKSLKKAVNENETQGAVSPEDHHPKRLFNTKSQPRTGHTREPDPTHNELKHTITPFNGLF